MNRSGSGGKPLVIESDATLANGTEAPVQGATAETLAGDVNVTLTPLQPAVPHDSGQLRFRDDDGPLWQPTRLEFRKATVLAAGIGDRRG